MGTDECACPVCCINQTLMKCLGNKWTRVKTKQRKQYYHYHRWTVTGYGITTSGNRLDMRQRQTKRYHPLLVFKLCPTNPLPWSELRRGKNVNQKKLFQRNYKLLTNIVRFLQKETLDQSDKLEKIGAKKFLFI